MYRDNRSRPKIRRVLVIAYRYSVLEPSRSPGSVRDDGRGQWEKGPEDTPTSVMGIASLGGADKEVGMTQWSLGSSLWRRERWSQCAEHDREGA